MQLEHDQKLLAKFSFNKKVKPVGINSKFTNLLVYCAMGIAFFSLGLNEYTKHTTNTANMARHDSFNDMHTLEVESGVFINDIFNFNQENKSKHFFDLKSNKLFTYSGYDKTIELLMNNKTFEKIEKGYQISVNTKFNNYFPYVYMNSLVNGKFQTIMKVPYQTTWTKDGTSEIVNKVAVLTLEKIQGEFKLVDISEENTSNIFK